MSGNRLETSQQATMRSILRVAGVVTLLSGGVLTLIGFGSFLTAFGTFEPPRYFWCAFLGLPLLGIGSAMAKLGFMGVIHRYIAGEAAPVAKDVVNYMGEGIQPGVRSIAKAVTQGVKDGLDEKKPPRE